MASKILQLCILMVWRPHPDLKSPFTVEADGSQASSIHLAVTLKRRKTGFTAIMDDIIILLCLYCQISLSLWKCKAIKWVLALMRRTSVLICVWFAGEALMTEAAVTI